MFESAQQQALDVAAQAVALAINGYAAQSVQQQGTGGDTEACDGGLVRGGVYLPVMVDSNF